MNYDEIITFLEIVKAGSITKAAEKLYISQGNASSRIQGLEDKLKIQLFYRQKGVRKIILTPQGEKFLTLAQQYISLFDEAKSIKNMQEFQVLRVTSNDSINHLLFIDFYKTFMNMHPNIILSIQTEHATQIYEQIENQQIDLGFAYNLHNSKNVIATPLFKEEFVFIFHKNSKFYLTKNIQDLNTDHEIHFNYSSQFYHWYKQIFPYSQHPKITLGTIAMIQPFIQEKNTWSIIPQNMAEILCRSNNDLTYTKIKDNTPTRTAYYFQHKYPKPWTKFAIDIFLNELELYIETNSSILKA